MNVPNWFKGVGAALGGLVSGILTTVPPHTVLYKVALGIAPLLGAAGLLSTGIVRRP